MPRPSTFLHTMPIAPSQAPLGSYPTLTFHPSQSSCDPGRRLYMPISSTRPVSPSDSRQSLPLDHVFGPLHGLLGSVESKVRSIGT